jgi:hypothetical protein
MQRLYAKYKCMLLIAVVKNPYYNIREGLNKQTFIDGVTKGSL